jgi:heme/copper-type cytochrome/quinol oxidase subunit 2
MISGNLNANGITLQNPLQATEFEDILENIIDFIFNIAIVLVPLIVVIAGILFVTAGGNLEQINKAKTMIIWTAIGFLIILLSKGIMGIITNLLGVG